MMTGSTETQKDSESAKLTLPTAPPSETEAVKAWNEPVVLRTYNPAPPDPNPLFLEKRVYQGSSGRVYPLPVIDRIETEAIDQEWEAVHLENQYLRLMVLPQIGGRIHVGVDKRNGYDFFYRQNVIKPALVGLAGPWISGGVEFNWPQHHRPATYMPVEVEIERSADGSITIWCSDHDPMTRMKGMHGIRLRPGRAYVEVRVRLYNRTTDTQTFLWWANVATHVHEKYQSFFPKDVRVVADHAKRATTQFPLSQGTYYGVNYGERAKHGVPTEEMPSCFVPDGSYEPNDLSWYSNIPVPTSYMIAGSRGDFAGGYDHKRAAGLVHFSNHHIAPGKKQWTWGNHNFGYAWDRSLTDADGPYVELMAGAYTDNQPDFSFLAPGETKTFSQYWYPIREIGVPDLANLDAALHVEKTPAGILLHLEVTSELRNLCLRVREASKEIDRWEGDLSPAEPLHHAVAKLCDPYDLEVILERDGEVLLRYAPAEIEPAEDPVVATEPPLPDAVSSSDELFLIGLHLEQYRHPTRSPDAYWREALCRDAGDSRANHAMGRWHMRRGEFELAEKYLRNAIARLTERNPNPYDGEPHYNLGLTLCYQGQMSKSYDAFYKSTWNAAWRGPAYHRLAEIDCSRQQWNLALDHIECSLRAEADNLNARNLKTILLQKLGREVEAREILRETRKLDPLDIFSRWLLSRHNPEDPQQRLDLAFDLERCGLLEEAVELMTAPHLEKIDGTEPLLHYAAAHFLQKLKRPQEAAEQYRKAAAAPSQYVFPSRLEEMLLLQEATERNPSDSRAAYFLGNLLYDRRRHAEAMAQWSRAAELDPQFPTVWRNLGFGYFNAMHNPSSAVHAFERARALAPQDARILYEYDQLLKRTGAGLKQRLKMLQQNAALVKKRDDLSVELASLLNSVGEPGIALGILLDRHFQPWEGGEGQVLTQYVRAHLLIAQRALQQGDFRGALEQLKQAEAPPTTLSEAKHLLMNMSMVDYFAGVAEAGVGNTHAAAERWERAAKSQGDFQHMQVQDVSENTFWSAMALTRLAREDEAKMLFAKIAEHGRQLILEEPKIDYFATSLPAMLLFEEDLRRGQKLRAQFLQAQALIGSNGAMREEGLKVLEEILYEDNSNTGAIDLFKLFGR
ncbi:DUF5107 domain-containing protein [Edaphobacter paludis]|uniref:DUF5107 domain-containing protein n=1 Tax=Edaphobacter paludis TaxID=3035702 RepID=A0AAU7D6V0_9BACT